MQRSRSSWGGQASQPCVAERLTGHIDVGEGYEGIVAQVIAVDFVAMLALWLEVNDSDAATATEITCA